MARQDRFLISMERYMAARNALAAKYTYERLDEEQKHLVDQHIVDMLILSGISPGRAVKYKRELRETQYFGMAALAMAFLNMQPDLAGLLFRDRWEPVKNPLVALTGAEAEIQMASNNIMRKHRVAISVSDQKKKRVEWERLMEAQLE